MMYLAAAVSDFYVPEAEMVRMMFRVQAVLCALSHLSVCTDVVKRLLPAACVCCCVRVLLRARAAACYRRFTKSNPREGQKP